MQEKSYIARPMIVAKSKRASARQTSFSGTFIVNDFTLLRHGRTMRDGRFAIGKRRLYLRPQPSLIGLGLFECFKLGDDWRQCVHGIKVSGFGMKCKMVRVTKGRGGKPSLWLCVRLCSRALCDLFHTCRRRPTANPRRHKKGLGMIGIASPKLLCPRNCRGAVWFVSHEVTKARRRGWVYGFCSLLAQALRSLKLT